MIKVIIKQERHTKGSIEPILFLPNCPANPGMIAYCSPYEGHGEASIGYYHECEHVAPELREKWRTWYENLGTDNTPVSIAYRQSSKDRAEAWQ